MKPTFKVTIQWKQTEEVFKEYTFDNYKVAKDMYLDAKRMEANGFTVFFNKVVDQNKIEKSKL